MRSNLVAGLDIGSTRTCAVIGELVGEERRQPGVKILGVGQARTTGLRGQSVTNIEETTDSVRSAVEEAELMAGVSVDRLYVGISGEHVETRHSLGVVAVGGDEIVPADMERVHEVARAVALPPDRELLHVIPTDYVVDHQSDVKHPVGMSATRLEAQVYLVTCATTAADNIRKVVTRAGYRLQELVFEPLATARAVLTEDEKEVGAAMVEVGGSTTDIAVYYEGKIRHAAILPVAGGTVTQDLVKGLNIPFVEATKAKESAGVAFSPLVDPQESIDVPGPAPGQVRQVARELIAHVIEQRMDELFHLVQEELEHEGLLDGLGAGIVLTGGGATMAGTVELAQHVFAAPVRLGVPSEGLSGLADSVGRPRFACGVGLALWGADRYAQTGEGTSTLASGVVTRVGAWLREFF